MLRRTIMAQRPASLLTGNLRNASAPLVGSSYINGEFITKADSTIDVYNPATNTVMGVIPNHGKAETETAIAAAAEAQVSWAQVAPQKRAEILRKWCDGMRKNKNLPDILTLEAGKPLAEAAGENLYSSNFVDWYAGEAERIYGDIIAAPRPGVRVLVQKEPVGVVGCITPWNFPSAMITRTVAGALAAGCSIVLKPSELTPFSAIALCELAEEAGVPKGVINIVNGEAPPIGEAMMESSVVRKFCFTGSTRVGKLLLRQSANTVKKVGMELGGNAPLIIFDDAEIDNAVAQTIAGSFRNAGQVCVSANRIFVQEKIYNTFAEKLAHAVKTTLKPGNGFDEGVTMGPMINQAAVDRIEKVVNDAVKNGATIAAGGKRIPGEGYFFEPTVLTNVAHNLDACQNELFGPVAPLVKFSTEEEVVQLANSTKAGLAGYFFTTDHRRQWRLSEKLKFGMVGVNEAAISTPVAPFGGVKESGLGRDGSKYGIEAFTDIKYVMHGGKL